MHYRSRTRLYVLSPSRRWICKPLLRDSLNAFAIQSVKQNKSTRKAILKVVSQLLHSEVACLCSDDFDSFMKQKWMQCLKNFETIVTVILDEMKSMSPTILSLLQSCLKQRSLVSKPLKWELRHF